MDHHVIMMLVDCLRRQKLFRYDGSWMIRRNNLLLLAVLLLLLVSDESFQVQGATLSSYTLDGNDGMIPPSHAIGNRYPNDHDHDDLLLSTATPTLESFHHNIWDYIRMMKEEQQYLDDKWEQNLNRINNNKKKKSNRNATTTTFQEDERHRLLGKTCVSSTSQLAKAVKSSKSSTIIICSSRLTLGSNRRRILIDGKYIPRRNRGGINMSHRNIKLRCRLPNRTQRCILDGEGITRIFYGTNTTLSIRGFNFTNALAWNSYGASLSFHDNSVITISDSSFIDNEARYGGAITVTNSTLILDATEADITLEGNKALYAGGIFSYTSTIVATTSDFNFTTTVNTTTTTRRTRTRRLGNAYSILLDNNTASVDGGAIYVSNGNAALSGITMTSNSATGYGGAGMFVSADVLMEDIDASYNSANDTGGALVFSSSNLSAYDFEATYNVATKFSGAVAFFSSTASIIGLIVTGNVANSTGGIGFDQSDAYLQNGTIEENNSTNDGATMRMFKSKVNMFNATFDGNIGSNGDIFIVDSDNRTFIGCNRIVFCGGSANTSLRLPPPPNGTPPPNSTDCATKGDFRTCPKPPPIAVPIPPPMLVPIPPPMQVPILPPKPPPMQVPIPPPMQVPIPPPMQVPIPPPMPPPM